jgi:WD40 repeat protein
MAFSPDARRLVTAADHSATATECELTLWDITRLVAGQGQIGGVTVAGTIRTVIFSPDGHTLVTVSGDDRRGLITFWHAPDPVWSHRRKSWKPWRPTGIRAADLPYASTVAYSPDGRILAIPAGSTVWLWDASDPAQPGHLGTIDGSFDHVHAAAFSPDGQALAAADQAQGGRVAIWDLTGLPNSATMISELTGLGMRAHCAGFSPDGRTLATSSSHPEGQPSGGEVTLWDIATHVGHPAPLTVFANLATTDTISFSRDGRILATSGDTPGSIVLWNINAGR